MTPPAAQLSNTGHPAERPSPRRRWVSHLATLVLASSAGLLTHWGLPKLWNSPSAAAPVSSQTATTLQPSSLPKGPESFTHRPRQSVSGVTPAAFYGTEELLEMGGEAADQPPPPPGDDIFPSPLFDAGDGPNLPISVRAPSVESPEAPSDLVPSPDEGDMRFSFNYQDAPWDTTLQQFSEQAGWTLQMTAVPRHGFTCIDPQQYTLAEALDIFNDSLLTERFIAIRHGRSLTVLDASAKFPEELVPLVTPEEIATLGRNELVRVAMPVRNGSPVAAAEELPAILSPIGRVQPLSSSQRVLITDVGSSLQRVQHMNWLESDPKDAPEVTAVAPPTPARVMSGQTIVLGGVITREVPNPPRRMPILGAIPGLGAAFRCKSRDTHCQEQMIFMTPVILGDDECANRQKLDEMHQFLMSYGNAGQSCDGIPFPLEGASVLLPPSEPTEPSQSPDSHEDKSATEAGQPAPVRPSQAVPSGEPQPVRLAPSRLPVGVDAAPVAPSPNPSIPPPADPGRPRTWRHCGEAQEGAPAVEAVSVGSQSARGRRNSFAHPHDTRPGGRPPPFTPDTSPDQARRLYRGSASSLSIVRGLTARLSPFAPRKAGLSRSERRLLFLERC